MPRLPLPLLSAVTIVALLGLSCRSQRMNTVFDLRDGGERRTETRYTTTKHIDSVDIRALKVDVWKLEHYTYPDSIRMFVRVLDTNGHVVTNMAAPYARPDAPNYFPRLVETVGTRKYKRTIGIENFRVREYGDKDSIPTYIALAIDYSGSMKFVREYIAEGTKMFVGMKRPCDFVSITAFHKQAKVVVPLTDDAAYAVREYDDYDKRTQGLFSSVNDGIFTSLKTLDTVPPTSPKVVVVFADGDENASSTKIQSIFEHAVKNNVSIYCVGFGYAKDEELQGLSLYTGGKYYRAYSKSDLKAIFLDIYNSLKNYYLVHYVPPKYDGLHVVDVTVDVPGRDTLIARGQYDKSPLNPIYPTDEFSRPILFAYNSSTIDSVSMFIIDEIADNLDRFDRVVLEVQGHTDNVGGKEYNDTLSLRRAESVKQALVYRGISAKRLRTRGFGFTVPVAPNDSDTNRALNRRTVFKVLRQ